MSLRGSLLGSSRGGMSDLNDFIKTTSIDVIKRNANRSRSVFPRNGESRKSKGIPASKFDWVASYFVFLSLVLLFPLVANVNVTYATTMPEYSSSECRMFAVASLSVCVALAVDMFMDFLSSKEVGYFYLRFFSLTSLSTYGLVFIIPSSKFAELQTVFDKFQVFSEISIVLWILNSLDTKRIWTTWRVTFLNSIYFTCFILTYLSNFYGGPYGSSLLSIGGVVLYITYGLFLLSVLQWMYAIQRELLTYLGFVTSLQQSSKKELSYETYYSGIIIVTVASCLIIDAVFGYIVGAIINLNDDSRFYTLSYYVDGEFIIRTGLIYFLCLLPSRMYKRKAAEIQYDATVKTSFVKYVSHEMRTPMNIISLGLELLSSQVKELNATSPAIYTTEELLRTCTEAQEILDNLLLYERTVKVKEVHLTNASALSGLIAALKPMVPMAQYIEPEIVLLGSDLSKIVDLQDVEVSVASEFFGALIRKLMLRAVWGGTDENKALIGLTVVKATREAHEKVGHSQRTGSRRSKVVPVDSAYVDDQLLRISITAINPLEPEEVKSLQDGELNLEREANNGANGFGLVGYLVNRVLALHQGEVNIDFLDPRVLHVDIPCRRGGEKLESDIGAIQELWQKFAKTAKASIIPERKSEVVSAPSAASLPDQRVLGADESMILPDGAAEFEKECTLVIPLSTVPKTVLIVDDSAMNRKMLAKVMQTLKYECKEAEHGAIAVKKVEEMMRENSQFDVILLDNEMPVMRGRDAVKKLREMGYKGLVLGVTGNALSEDIDDFMMCGVDEVILKPMTTAKFKDVLERLTVGGLSSVTRR